MMPSATSSFHPQGLRFTVAMAGTEALVRVQQGVYVIAHSRKREYNRCPLRFLLFLMDIYATDG